MNIRKKVKPVIVAIGLIALVSATIGNANARLSYNGFALQGVWLNGLSFNAMNFNGLYLNAMNFNALNFNGFPLNALSLNGSTYNGMSINGSMSNGKLMHEVLPNYVEMPEASVGKPSRISAKNGQLIIEINQ